MKSKVISLLLLLLLVGFGFISTGCQKKAEEEVAVEDVEPVNTVEVLHWWTSGGEAAALNVLKGDLEKKGISWTDSPVAGGGGGSAMTVLRTRAIAGNPPVAVQMLGFDIIDWAELGLLADLNDLAEKEGWDKVIPDALKQFSKYNGVWVAAPVNIHSTNWVWANKKILDNLEIAIPETWDEFIAAMEKVKASGLTALAHGGQDWQEATMFDGVVLSTGGVDFYKKAFIELDDTALRSNTMVEAFKRMEQLRSFVDDNFSGRDWNLASSMVIEGQAAFQIMGDWAKGEFKNAGQVPGEDFVAFRVPGTQDAVTFNADQFVMFNVNESQRAAQKELASSILAPEFQIAFNLVKGSVPARMDISDSEFDIIGKKGMKDLSEASKNGTLMGSMAHGHAAPASVKNALYDVVTSHFNGIFTAGEAAKELADAIQSAKE